MSIRACVYHPNHCPRQVLVPTRCSLPAKLMGPRYPYAESVLADSKIQPYVHNCFVTVTESRNTYRVQGILQDTYQAATKQVLVWPPRLYVCDESSCSQASLCREHA